MRCFCFLIALEAESGDYSVFIVTHKGYVMKKVILISALGFFLTGCATTKQYPLNFDSQPQGASLICNGQSMGYTPQVLYYDVEYSPESPNVLRINNHCQGVWSSGVSGSYPTQFPIYPSGGTRYTLQRPNLPGYSQDAEFALKVRNLEANQRAAVAAQRSASAAEQQNFNKIMNQNNSFNNTINCKRMGVSLYPEIKTFSSMICPLGWMQAF